MVDINNTLNDVAYLIDEIEALHYVVDAVPVHDRPGDSLSIAELIRMIDFGQLSYFRPEIETILDSGKSNGKVNLLHIEVDFRKDRLDIDEERKKGINAYLRKIIKNRASLISFIESKQTYGSDLYNLLTHMVQFERNLLKQVAERVLSIKRDE